MVIPLGDDNLGRKRTPFVVFGLIALNALVWLLQLQAGESFTNGFATVPLEITGGTDIIGTRTVRLDGQAFPIRHYDGPSPIYLTLLTAMFMHGSWMHIIGNMLYLWIFGDQIEDLLGPVKFVLFYVVCGVAASVAQIVVDPDSIIPALGASGAIAGVLGAYLVKHPSNRIRVLVGRHLTTLPAFVVLGLWILIQLVSQVGLPAGQASGVAYMAHIGGFVAGLVLVFAFAKAGRVGSRQYGSRQ